MHNLMFDSNVFHKLRDNPEICSFLERLSVSGVISIFITSIQTVENSHGPHPESLFDIRSRLGVRNVSSLGFVWDFSRLDVDRIGPEESRWVVHNTRNNRDEVIAATAEEIGAIIVTQEAKGLRSKAKRNNYPVMNLKELVDWLQCLTEIS